MHGGSVNCLGSFVNDILYPLTQSNTYTSSVILHHSSINRANFPAVLTDSTFTFADGIDSQTLELLETGGDNLTRSHALGDARAGAAGLKTAVQIADS